MKEWQSKVTKGRDDLRQGQHELDDPVPERLAASTIRARSGLVLVWQMAVGTGAAQHAPTLLSSLSPILT
jgi:hypothetical protein